MKAFFTHSFLLILLLFCFSEYAHSQKKDKKIPIIDDIKKFQFYKELHEINIWYRVKGGYGLHYSLFGVNAEAGIGCFSLNGGMGWTFMRSTSKGLGLNIGARGYILKDEKKIRPRISAHYGVNNVYEEAGRAYKAYGFSLGLGFEHKLTERIVYDIDYYYLFNGTNTNRPAVKEFEGIALPAVGVGIYF